MNKYVLIASTLLTLASVSFAVYIKFVSNHLLIGTIVTFIAFFAIFSFITMCIKDMFSTNKVKKEGFANMAASPADYPQTHDRLLLEDIYPANLPFQKSEHTFETMWMEYPSFPARSMKTNQIRYWDSPDNGTCSLPHQCGAFYKKIEPENPSKPMPPVWGSGIRVNFYDSQSFNGK